MKEKLLAEIEALRDVVESDFDRGYEAALDEAIGIIRKLPEPQGDELELRRKIANTLTGSINSRCCHHTGGDERILCPLSQCECQDTASDILKAIRPYLRTEPKPQDGWLPIDEAKKLHQIYLLGYDADVGAYNMHWRDDKKHWCYTWNQGKCYPTDWMPLPPAPPKEPRT